MRIKLINCRNCLKEMPVLKRNYFIAATISWSYFIIGNSCWRMQSTLWKFFRNSFCCDFYLDQLRLLFRRLVNIGFASKKRKQITTAGIAQGTNLQQIYLKTAAIKMNSFISCNVVQMQIFCLWNQTIFYPTRQKNLIEKKHNICDLCRKSCQKAFPEIMT